MSFKGKNYWAVILGGSSGFGLASAKKLGLHGMNICIVHRDTRGAMQNIQKEFDEIQKNNIELLTFNLDALSQEGRKKVSQVLTEKIDRGKIRLLLHSIAFGNLKPLAHHAQTGNNPEDELLLQDEDFANTIYAMGTSLASWVGEFFSNGLFCQNSRVIGLTSEGNEVAWRGYAAVSAAKCALESVSRSIAVEYAAFGIRSNILQPGVTDTPALRLIPGSDEMKRKMKEKNPLGRLTTPQDVADVVYLLCREEASWINGSLIRVDGGEHIAG